MASGAERVRKHREKMKAAGLKPVTIWVPDVNTPEYQAKIARAIDAINASESEEQILEELSDVDFDGWK
ncbi:MAG: antitoxin MazE family protein [Tardiphaga sp.]